METTIKRIVKASILNDIFENHSNEVNIRYYNVLNLNEGESFNSDKKYKFQIKIRHSETERATEIFDKLHSKLKK